MRCANCKHWKKDDIRATGLAICNGVHHQENAFGWDKDYEKYGPKEGHENDLAFAIDGSGYFAAIVTKADFFCAHYKGHDFKNLNINEEIE